MPNFRILSLNLCRDLEKEMKILNADNRGNRCVRHSEINATIKMDAVCSSESLELTQSQKITRSSKMFTVTKTLKIDAKFRPRR